MRTSKRLKYRSLIVATYPMRRRAHSSTLTDPSKCFDDPNALAFSPWYPFMNTTARPDTANSTPERIWLESESCFLLFRNAASANVAPAQAQNLYYMVTPSSENTRAPSV